VQNCIVYLECVYFLSSVSDDNLVVNIYPNNLCEIEAPVVLVDTSWRGRRTHTVTLCATSMHTVYVGLHSLVCV